MRYNKQQFLKFLFEGEDKRFLLKQHHLQLTPGEAHLLCHLILTKYRECPDYNGEENFNQYLSSTIYDSLRNDIQKVISEMCKIYFTPEEINSILFENKLIEKGLPSPNALRTILHDFPNRKKLKKIKTENLEILYLYGTGKIKKDFFRDVTIPENAKIFLMYLKSNESEAQTIKSCLKSLIVNKINEILIDENFDLAKIVYDSDDDTIIIELVSKESLMFPEYQRQFSSIKDIRMAKEKYYNRTIHILHPNLLDGEFNIHDSNVYINFGNEVKKALRKLEKTTKDAVSIANYRSTSQNMIDEIIPNLGDGKRSVPFDSFKFDGSRRFYLLRKIVSPFEGIMQAPKAIVKRDNKFSKAHLNEDKVKSKSIAKNEVAFYEKVIKRKNEPPVDIPVPSTRELEENVFIIDQSKNPTGTHKDWMAWRIVNKYKEKYLSFDHNVSISVISKGSTALALYHRIKREFDEDNTPILKVLMHKENYNAYIYKALKKEKFCEIFFANLSLPNYIEAEHIKTLTDNDKGIDVSFREFLDTHFILYFDYLSYEILNLNPDYIFVPFSNGDLFINLLTINKKQLQQHSDRRKMIKDERFKGNPKILKDCNFFGATSMDQKSEGYFYLYPNHDKYRGILDEYKMEGYCGKGSEIKDVSKKFVSKAEKIAKSKKIKSSNASLYGLALYLQMREEKKIGRDKRVVIVMTGKPNLNVKWNNAR